MLIQLQIELGTDFGGEVIDERGTVSRVGWHGVVLILYRDEGFACI
jgi:hypothetical protein